jgi:peptidyl-prolyl cis-trans isomerase SurA|tara:strand:- start:745 stop:1677 length:933 start_codon:yes stop_codon:yes gene_type:complete
MKLKIILYLIIILFSNNFNAFSNSKIFIAVTVNNEIITNQDITKEKQYLKILNPDLSKLDENKMSNIAKNSLINQIVKKNEVEKFFDLEEKKSLVEEVFKDLLKKLNFDNQEDFKKSLIKENEYTIEEIKKNLKIELYWNELIFFKYKDMIKINKDDLKRKINAKKNNFEIEFLLSEIFFNKKKDKNLNNQIELIKKSINDIGFNNTANIFSISESANFGGKIGWVKENNLSKQISKELSKIKIGQHTEVIQIGNNYLIIKIDDIRTNKILIDKKKQLQEMINYETNRQLTQYSNIYFNKIKINHTINEK